MHHRCSHSSSCSLLFGIAYSHGYFQADLSYMHTFLSRSEVAKVRFYGFFRLYDWPARIGFLLFLILVGRQNILGVFPALLGYISVVIASLSLVILLGKRLGSVEMGKSLKAAFFRIFSLTVDHFNLRPLSCKPACPISAYFSELRGLRLHFPNLLRILDFATDQSQICCFKPPVSGCIFRHFPLLS